MLRKEAYQVLSENRLKVVRAWIYPDIFIGHPDILFSVFKAISATTLNLDSSLFQK